MNGLNLTEAQFQAQMGGYGIAESLENSSLSPKRNELG